MGQAFMKLLAAKPQRSDATAQRIERVFVQVLEHAKRLRPDAGEWDWELVLVGSDAAAPFALPDGQIFVSPKWVAGRRLNDAEIALLLGHEMAHVIAEHMLARISAFAAPRPRYLRVADVLRTLEQEWYLARELEPLIQSQELEADRIGMSIVCGAAISRRRALTLFDKMARAERATSYINTHSEPLERKAALDDWSRAQGLPCID
jgi:Zn-dependent protease with chaperone function